MERNISALVDRQYDLVVIGGGIFGICVAWDAVLRGLSVAIVERDDFAQATSGNCFKIVHGGIRYVQHLDVTRVRESSREQNTFLRIAPHLVDPLPIVIPTYGHGLDGKEILALGLSLFNLMTPDRNRGIRDPGKKLPRGQVLSRREILELFPGLRRSELTGGVTIYDAQMRSPTRIALSFLRSATDKGAEAANYASVRRLLLQGKDVCGVRARDELTGHEFDIRGKVVINAAGPWAERL